MVKSLEMWVNSGSVKSLFKVSVVTFPTNLFLRYPITPSSVMALVQLSPASKIVRVSPFSKSFTIGLLIPPFKRSCVAFFAGAVSTSPHTVLITVRFGSSYTSWVILVYCSTKSSARYMVLLSFRTIV